MISSSSSQAVPACNTFCRCHDSGSWVTKQRRSLKLLYIYSNMFSIPIECWNAINWKLPDGMGLTFENNDNFMLICCTLPAGGWGLSVSVRGCNALWPLTMVELPGWCYDVLLYSGPHTPLCHLTLTPVCHSRTGSLTVHCTAVHRPVQTGCRAGSYQLDVAPVRSHTVDKVTVIAWCRCNGITAVTSWYQQ